ncbi:MAG: UDP-glucose 4-epimerase GalE [Desulfococcus multivorans]|jgi:UDP-glucose-4-epimerase GalE|uniref:UDP-glucose 4-epimerase GalE n=1 Tax=Desulfococcus sp. TaxID=2025834 RepID=UPI002A48663B|nr:UDP-glucose 4-epimerase GalE [Desulfococcus multivorans]
MADNEILVVGGAGYIGSHMCKYLWRRGYRPIVLDNLVCGHRAAVQWGPFIQGDIGDPETLDRVFSEYDIKGVLHFAAYTCVPESVDIPLKYYGNNVANTINLLQGMVRHGVNRLIFSSSCATYGVSDGTPMSEDHVQHPITPYGRTKWMVEQILDDVEAAYGLRAVCLRYFNAAGADPDGHLGEDHRPETHLIPIIIKTALGQRDFLSVYGDDYPTRDGTCVRDYIHVEDLAQAHLLALERLLAGGPGGKYNLGNGDGATVREVIERTRGITQASIPVRFEERRPGDVPVLIGSSEKAIRELGWRPQYSDLDAIIETAWNWHRRYPDGYPE